MTALMEDSFTVPAADGTSLFVACWDAPGSSAGGSSGNGHKDRAGNALFILHGFGEHSGRYRQVPIRLGGNFGRFYAMDLRGHGRSGGIRGHSRDFETLLDDVKRVLAEVRAREKGATLHLLAHSFGGLVMLTLLLREDKLPFRSAVITSPLLDLSMPVNPVLKGVARALEVAIPILQLSSQINPMHLSHDPASTEAYLNDRLVHSKITLRMYRAMLEAMAWARSQTGPLPCPTLMIAAGDDRVVSTPAIRQFFKSLKPGDTEFREYPGMFHEVLNELEREKVFADIHAWLRVRLDRVQARETAPA